MNNNIEEKKTNKKSVDEPWWMLSFGIFFKIILLFFNGEKGKDNHGGQNGRRGGR